MSMTMIFLISAVTVNIILLAAVLVRLHAIGKAGFSDGALLRVKEELREGSDDSLRSIQASLDRDMTRLLAESREGMRENREALERTEKVVSSLSSSVLEYMRTEAENSSRRALSMEKSLSENFDRIREDNRSSFLAISSESARLKQEVAAGMERIRAGNEKKLSEIQGVVDIKLQETLDRRIASSFAAVSENLTKLYKAMGTLDSLSLDIRKMNSLFSNVKSRGVWGEMQAETILSDILTPAQYVRNYSPRKNREAVEFAVRLPGKEGEVYLPVDSKFPVADYERYLAAAGNGDAALAETEMKNMKRAVEKEAKAIRDLYVVPPSTTDFAILFIPSEALYLDVLRIDGLAQKLQNEYRVVITGPGSFAALLNSLSLGFRTVQIEEYTSTIWHLFEDLKKLFSDLAKSVDESKKHVDRASESLDSVKRRKDRISSVLAKIETSAEKAAISEINEYYLEEKSTDEAD